MNDIITIHEENAEYPVSGRELHQRLGIETRYNDWFARMTEYGFEQGKDFEVLLKNEQNPAGGRPATDHMLTLSMAKELCMLQRTDAGREVRRYLIRVEDAWNSPDAIMQRALTIANERVKRLTGDVLRLQGKLEQDEPYTQFGRGLSENEGSVKVRDFAKALHNDGIDTGERRLYAWLRGNGYLQQDNAPYQRYVDMGLFEVRMVPMTINGMDRIARTTYVTGKGQRYLYERLKARMERAVGN